MQDVKKVNFDVYDSFPENHICITNAKALNSEELVKHIFESPLGYLNSILENSQKSEYKFDYLCYAVEYGCFYKQYIDFVEFSLKIFSRIDTKIQNDLKSINKILNGENLTKFKDELINFVKNYLENKSPDDLNYEKLINTLSALKILKDKQIPMINFIQFNCICLYIKHIINQNIIEEINFVCSLIEEAKNVTNTNFVNSLYEKANQFLNSNSIPISYSLSTCLVPPSNIYPFITTNQEQRLIAFIDFLLEKTDIFHIEDIFLISHFRATSNTYNWFYNAAFAKVTPLQFQVLSGSLFYKIKEIFNEINQTPKEGNAKELLSSKDYERIQNGLINLAQNFPVENPSLYCTYSFELYNFYLDLKENLDIEFKKGTIKDYFDKIIRNKIDGEINLAYQLISTTQDEITNIFDYLFKMAASFIFLDECLLEKFTFPQLKNMIENEDKFAKLLCAIKYGLSLQEFYESIEFFLNTIGQNEATFELLKDNKIDKKGIQKKLTDFLRNYHEENKSEENSKCEKIAKTFYYLKSSVEKNFAFTHFSPNYNFFVKANEQKNNFSTIESYLKEIVNLNNFEEINLACHYIDSSKNIDSIFEHLLNARKKYKNKQTNNHQTDSVPKQESSYGYQEEK